MTSAIKSYNPDTFKPVLNKLVTSPHTFTTADTREAVEHIARVDGATPAQIGSFLTALKLSGHDHASDTLQASAEVMRTHSLEASVGDKHEFIVDIVGTGGDGHNTFNVSTTSAIVAAGAGARVCKVCGGVLRKSLARR